MWVACRTELMVVGRDPNSEQIKNLLTLTRGCPKKTVCGKKAEPRVTWYLGNVFYD